MMPVWLAGGLGGVAGSRARWQVGVWTRAQWPAFPWGTLLVNVSGSFVIGMVAGFSMLKPLPDWVRIGVMTGILGGYTTFSAFSLDTLDLWKTGTTPALVNLVANLGMGLLACAIGLWAGRQIAF